MCTGAPRSSARVNQRNFFHDRLKDDRSDSEKTTSTVDATKPGEAPFRPGTTTSPVNLSKSCEAAGEAPDERLRQQERLGERNADESRLDDEESSEEPPSPPHYAHLRGHGSRNDEDDDEDEDDKRDASDEAEHHPKCPTPRLVRPGDAQPASGAINYSPFMGADLGSTENLLRNIQSLIKVAAETARQQERQSSYEKGECSIGERAEPIGLSVEL